jgi:hypothetical protein
MNWLGRIAFQIVDSVLLDFVSGPFFGRQTSEDLVLLCFSLLLEEPY